MHRRSRARSFGFTILPVSLFGAVVIAKATVSGIGIGSDSVAYIAAARNLLEGFGLSWVSGNGAVHPMTLHAPFFSILLAGFEALSVESVEAARLLNSLAFGSTIFLSGLILYRATKSIVIASLGGIILSVTGEMIEVHSWVMSDQIYIPLSLLSILTLLRYRDTKKLGELLLAVVALSLAALTRYIGISLIAASAIFLSIMVETDKIKRLKIVIVTLIVSLLPLTMWLVRNSLQTGLMTGRQSVWTPHALDEAIRSGSKIILNWFLPLRLVDLINNQPIFVMMGALVLGIGLAIFLWKILRNKDRGEDPTRFDRAVPSLLILYVSCYVILLLVTAMTSNPASDINERILIPVYPVLLIILLWSVWQFWKLRRVSIYLLIIVLVGIFIRNKVVYGYWVYRGLQDDGQIYSSTAWKTSETIEVLREMDVPMVYTNEIAAVYYLADINPILIPIRTSLTTGEKRTDFDKSLSSMRRSILNQDAVLVLFDPDGLSDNYATLDELTLELVPVHIAEDGVIYGNMEVGPQ